MTPDRKRARWVSWLPAMILAVVIVASLITGFILVRGGLGSPVPSPTAGQVSDLNWSSFTEDGLAYIERSRDIRIDLSDKGEDAVALGLPANGTTVIGPNSEGLEYKFTFNGGGAGYGGDRLIVTQITITTVDGLITEVVAPIAQVDNFRTTVNGLIKQSELFGWDMSFVDALYDQVEQATKDGVGYQFTAGPADLVGVPVSANAQCQVTGYCQVTSFILPGLRSRRWLVRTSVGAAPPRLRLGVVGYGVIGNTEDSDSFVLGSSPGTPAIAPTGVGA